MDIGRTSRVLRSLLRFLVIAAVVAIAMVACGGQSAGGVGGRSVLTPSGTGGVNHQSRLDAPYVVLIALDGFRHDYLELYDAPNLSAVAARGVRADVVPPLPSKTFPSFYTLATGVRPGRHGIVANSFWDPDRGERFAMGDRATVQDGSWYGAEPIWVTAETQGMVAGSYFWVGTEAPVMGVQPTFWKPFEAGVPHEARVDSVLSWLSLPPERRVHLAGLYLEDTDNAGHFFGPRSPETGEAVRQMDAAIGRLLRGIAALPYGDRVHLVIVADHGIAGVRAEDIVWIDRPRYEGVSFQGTDEYVSAHVEGGSSRALEVRDQLRADLPRVDVQLASELPAPHDLGLSKRTGEIVLLPELGWRVAFVGRRPPDRRGGHGWDPRYREMHGVFIAAGPRILEGVEVSRIQAVDVYPFVAELLGLEGADVEGRLDALTGALRPPPSG